MITLSKLLRSAFLAAALAISATAGATPVSVDYSDLWSNPDEPGWGLNISQQGDVMFATLFVYDRFGVAAWYSVTLNYDSAGAGGVRKYSGILYQTSGTPSTQPYNPADLKYREVGTLTVEFGDEAHALLFYTVDGIAQAKQVTRLTFAENSILGSYIGASQDVTYDCANPERNGEVNTDVGPFTITQDETGYVLKFPTCIVTRGVYTQQGQIAEVVGEYNCTHGGNGLIKFSALRSEQGGIVGTVTGRNTTCSFRGTLGGARV
ncbi:MAG: hypothetical protein IT518_24180, partial [Burkholderiales bacterium]|nr:hypothetical protein [Burkholderiales bacterium]